MERCFLKIPFPGHLYRFMQIQLEDQDFHEIDANSPLGCFLMGIVENSTKPMPEPNGHYLTISLPARDQLGKSYDGRTNFVTISDVNIKRFHRLIDHMMKRDLYARLDLIQERNEAQRRGGKMTEEIEKFIALYSCDVQVLNIDTLRKAYYRYRKSRNLLTKKIA